MFRFTDFEIVNMGHHKRLRHTMRGGTLGLVGPTGSGKSTVLQALQFAIAGEIDHDDGLVSFIRESSAEEVKKMEVSAGFIANGRKGTIKREYTRSKTSKRTLFWDDEPKKTFTKAEDVAEVLREVMGADTKAILSTVFIPQGELSKIFAGTPTDRRDFYINLLAVGHLAKNSDVIEAHRKSVMSGIQDLSGVRDRAADAVVSATAYFEEIDDEFGRMADFSKEIAAASELLTIITRHESAEEALRSATEVKVTVILSEGAPLAKVDQWLQESGDKLRAQAEELAAIEESKAAVTRLQREKSAAREHQEAVRTWCGHHKRAVALREELEKVEALASQPSPRNRIAQLQRWDTAYRDLDVEKNKLESARPEVSELSAKVENAKSHYETQNKIYTELQDRYRDGSSQLGRQRKLKEDIEAMASAACCAACGSKNPDVSFLSESIDKAEKDLLKIRNQGEVVGTIVKQASDSLNEVTQAWHAASYSMEKTQSKIADLEAILVGSEPRESLAPEIERLSLQLPDYDAAVAIKVRAEGELRETQARMGTHTYTAEDLHAAAEEEGRLTRQLESMPSYEAMVAEQQQKTSARSILAEKVSKVGRAIQGEQAARKNVEPAKEKLTEALKELSKMPVLAAMLKVANSQTLGEVLTDLRSRETAYNEQKGRREAARRAKLEAEKEMAELELRIAEQQNDITIGQELADLAAAFKPTGIPKDYVAHHFEQIAELAQDHLASLGADFMVGISADKEFSFDFIRLNQPDAAWLPQSRMSGGQRVKLAIAILLSIHELVIPDVGLLVLDEPSLHLDTDSKIALGEMIRLLGEHSEDSGRQVIVCDHDDRVIDALDDKIVFTAQ